MSFDEIDIFLFEKFFSLKSDSKTILKMIQIHFNHKADKTNENKVINRLYDLPYIIQNYLYYQINRKILLKEKFSICVDNESYSKLVDSYNYLNNDIIKKFNFNKIPYNYFKSKTETNSAVINNILFSDKNRTEFFFHVILNYYYYIIFVHNNPNYKTQHNLLPPTFKNNKKDLSSLFDTPLVQVKNEKYKKYFINFLVKFFIRYNKKYPMIISSLNQLSLEILIHILIEYYSINNKTKISKFLFLFKSNPQQVFRTLMMFNEKNSHIANYKKFTNDLLNCFLTKSPNNIISIIKMFNIQGIDEENSLKIFLTMYTRNLIQNEHTRIKNLFCYFIELILFCIKIKNKILAKFLIKAIEEIFLSYSYESEIYNIYIFESFFSLFLRKFGIIMNFAELKFNYINNQTNNKSQNKSLIAYIGKKMNDYIYMISKYLELVLKKSFEYIFDCFDKGFLYIFDILNLINSESNFYYMNIENEEVKKYRKNIIEFISYMLGYCDIKKIAKEIYKYYFRPNYFWLKKNIKYNIGYLTDKESPGIKIEISKKLNFMELCSYLSSDEYQTKVLNSIENIFSSIPPFNKLEIQAALLENYLEELNEQNDMREKSDSSNIKEKVIELPKDLILNEEDENELTKYLDKISLNAMKYKEKIIFIVLQNLSKDTNDKEELTLISNPTKILYLMIKILSAESISENDEILINCIECVCTLHQIGKLFFDYEDEIKYISLIKDIQSKKAKEINKELNDKMTELLNELLTHVKNKNTENDEVNNIKTLGEEDKKIIELINNCKKVDMKSDKFELSFNLKKLNNELDTSPNINKARKISIETIQSLINYLNTLLTNRCFDDAFLSQNVLKSFRNLFLSIKSDENLRKFYLKLIGENLFNSLKTKKFVSEKQKATKIETSSKIFELFMKIIKKLKYKSFLVGKDILKILFEVFENYQKGIYELTPYSIVSCISICAYLVEYCHEEIDQYISIIVRTGINFLKSKSSTIEQQRASAFLLYKILDTLNDKELDVFTKEIFDACNIARSYGNDNALIFYLDKCLNYYS